MFFLILPPLPKKGLRRPNLFGDWDVVFTPVMLEDLRGPFGYTAKSPLDDTNLFVFCAQVPMHEVAKLTLATSDPHEQNSEVEEDNLRICFFLLCQP